VGYAPSPPTPTGPSTVGGSARTVSGLIGMAVATPGSANTVLLSASANGSAIRSVLHAAYGQASWSTNGQRVAYWSTPSVVTVATWPAGRTVATVAAGADAGVDLMLSPHGDHLAYIGSNGQLFVNELDGSPSRTIAHTDTAFGDPAWSPDDAELVYLTGSSAIRTIRFDGADDRQVVPRLKDGSDSSHPAWSPTGDQIVFSAGDGGLYVADARTGLARPILAAGSRVCGRYPSWSPGGTWIAVPLPPSHGLEEPNHEWPLWVLHPDGTSLLEVADGASDIDAPVWAACRG
jgi:TolB protein